MYAKLKETYLEPFFVRYAVRGPIDAGTGTRAGVPRVGPLCGYMKEPSPLNTQYVADAALRAQIDAGLPVNFTTCPDGDFEIDEGI